jgi:hypothetical protein
MGSERTHTAAFKSFGVSPTNTGWSWSGRNEQTNTVVHTLWEESFREKGNTLIYERTHSQKDSRGRQRPAYNELTQNMNYALQHCGGVFKVIVARDTRRAFREWWPAPQLRMKIRTFNASTGLLIADAVAPTGASLSDIRPPTGSLHE